MTASDPSIQSAGSESMINTVTAGDQSRPSIAKLFDPSTHLQIGTVAVWSGQQYNSGNFYDFEVVSQRFDLAGNKVGGPETIVNQAQIPGYHHVSNVVGLSNGCFVVVFEADDASGRGVFTQVYGPDGAPIADPSGALYTTQTVDSRYANQTQPYVAEVSGGFVVGFQQDSSIDGWGSGVFAQRYTVSGSGASASGYTVGVANQDGTPSAGTTTSPFQVNYTTYGDQGSADVVSLSGGGAIFFYTSADSNQIGQFARIMAADGSFGPELHLSSEAGSWQQYGTAVQLANGNIFATWYSQDQDGEGAGIYGRIISATGSFVTPEFRVSDSTSGDQGYRDFDRGPHMVLLTDGTVVVAWEADGADNSGRGAVARHFDQNGVADGHAVLLNSSTYSDELQPVLAALPGGGFRAVYSGYYAKAGGDSYDVYQRDFSVSGGTFIAAQPIVRTGGEDQVSTHTVYDQDRPMVTSFADGSYVIVWSSMTELSTGDGSGWGLFAQRYDAAGSRVGSEFQVNQVSAGDQYWKHVTALADGRFVVAWQSGPDGNSDIYARIFNHDGTAADQFKVDTVYNGSQNGYPDVTSLAGGGFVVSWRDAGGADGNSYNVVGQAYDAAGSAIGSKFVASYADAGANTDDGSEHQGRVLGLANGGFVVLFQDNSGQDGSGNGIFGRVYAPITDASNAITGFTPGTSFQVNTYTPYDQYDPALKLLANGDFVVVWTSQYEDNSGDGVYGRIFHADGSAATGEFRVSESTVGNQSHTDVTVLADGSFVVTWGSDQGDGVPGWDVYAARFSAAGVPIGDEFRINQQVIKGDENWPTIAATKDGFVVTWEQESPYLGTDDGDSHGVFKQQFTIDGLNAAAGQEKAGAPTISLLHTGNLLTDPGFESNSGAADFSTTITPSGWTLVKGAPSVIHYGTGDATDLTAEDGAQVQGGANYFSGGTGGDATITQSVAVGAPLLASVDAGTVRANFSGFFGGFTNQSDNATLTLHFLGANSVELGTATIGGDNVSQRTSATELLASAATAMLPVGTRTIVAELTSHSVTGSYNDGYADNLALNLEVIARGNEDTAIAIPVGVVLNDSNTSTPETLHVEIAGIPVGATLSDGAHWVTATVGMHSVDVSGWTLSALTITPPLHSEQDFTLEVRATATEPGTGSAYDTATTVITIPVDVVPVAQRVIDDAQGVRANSNPVGEQLDGHIAHASDGSFVVTWSSLGQDGSGWGIYMQRYNADGTPAGGETRVNTVTTSDQTVSAVTYLANGSYVVAWQTTEGSVYDSKVRVFAHDGTPLTGDIQVNPINTYFDAIAPAVTALADGGFVVGFHAQAGVTYDGSGNGVFAQRFDATGAPLHRDGVTAGYDPLQINTGTVGDQQNVKLASTSSGGFVATWMSNGQPGDDGWGVYAQIFDAAGQPSGGELHIDQQTDNSQLYPDVTVLSNGNFVVAWQSNASAYGYGNSAIARLYASDGTPLTSEFVVGNAGDGSQATVAALPNGHFAIGWTSSDGYGPGVFVQEYEADGDKIGAPRWLSNVPTESQSQPKLVYNGHGLDVVWTSDGVDGDGNAVVVREVSARLDAALTGGQRIVPTTVAHAQQNPHIATLSDGSYVVVWQTLPSAGHGDVSSWSVRAQHYAADGTAIGGEFTVNTNVAYDQSAPSIAALDDGGYVVVWHSQTGEGGDGFGIFAQKFDNADNRIGGELHINQATPGDQTYPDVTALHGAQHGGFAVAWETSSNIYSRAFDAAGAPIGGDQATSIVDERVNNADSGETRARITGDANGGYTVVWQDDDGDKHYSAVIGQHFTIAGGTVTPVGGLNADGSASADNFRFNTYYYGNQNRASVTTLSDGATLYLWYDENAPYEVKGQIANADGTLRGGEFNVSDYLPDAQYEQAAAALPGGGFVVVFTDRSTEGYSGGDVVARVFDGQGHASQIIPIARNPGVQFQPQVAAEGDGFTVVWTSNNGQDGFGNGDGGSENYAVVQQHVSLNQSGGNAAVPVLTTSASTGNENSAIALHVAAALNATASGDTLKLVIEDVPVGATLADGHGHSFTATVQQPQVDITGWTLGSLTITPPTDYHGSFALHLRATETDTATHDYQWNVGTIQVTVAPIVHVLPAYGAERQDNAWTNDQQWQPTVASQPDGSYMVVWRSQSQPGQPYYTVMAQLHDATGAKVGSEFVVNTYGNNAYSPAVQALAHGGYIIAYTGYDSDSEGVHIQRVGADGTLLNIDGTPATAGANSSVIANTTHADSQRMGDGDQAPGGLTALADGGWVVAWTSMNQDGSSGGIYAQRYDASGTPVGGETQINTTTLGNQFHAAVTQFANGDLLYAWASPDNAGYGIVGRIFHSDGSSSGEFAISSTQPFDQQDPHLAALVGGRSIAVWESNGQDGSSEGVYGQLINADGTLQGAEFRINSYGANSQQEPEVTALPDGGFQVSWTSDSQDGSSWGVYAQRFDAAANTIGTEYRVNTTVPGDQSSPAIAVQGDGSGVVVAFEGQDGSGYGTYDVRLALPPATDPQPIQARGLEVQVNPVEANTSPQSQDVAHGVKLTDGSGSYVVVYQSAYQPGDDYWGVYMRHYSASGDLLAWGDGSTEKHVNTTTPGEQAQAQVTALANGQFAVTWHSNNGGSTGWDVMASLFDASGNRLTLLDPTGAPVTELRVSNGPADQQDPAIATGADGGFTVVFQAPDQSGLGAYAHHFTRLSDGHGGYVYQQDAGPDLQLNQNVDQDQGAVRVAALSNGNYIAVWHSLGHDGSGWGVYARMLDATGHPIGTEFLVNTYTDGEQSWPAVAALNNGGFVVTWQTQTGFDNDGDFGIAGQRFDASATPVGHEFQINGIAAYDQLRPDVIATQDGGFAVAWQSTYADGSGWGIDGRRFDANGNPTAPYGDDFQINTTTANNQTAVGLIALDRGFAAVWTSHDLDYTDPNNSNYPYYSDNIRMQRFEGAGLEPPPYVVDQSIAASDPANHLYKTIQEALDAAPPSRTILIHAGTYNEALHVATDDLVIKNATGETVLIQAPDASAPALSVNAGLNITIQGDTAAHLTFAGANGGRAIELAGNNDGTQILTTTVLSSGSGGSGVLFHGGQDGLLIQNSVFTGPDGLLIYGTSHSETANTGVIVTKNSFSSDANGPALVFDASGGKITQNVFDGSAPVAAGSLVVSGAGIDISSNRFQAGVGPHFYDPAGLYTTSDIVLQNSFPEGYVLVSSAHAIFATVTQALASAAAGASVSISGGNWSSEGVVPVPADNLTIDAPGGAIPATGLHFALVHDATHSAHNLTLTGGADVQVDGNDLDNVIHADNGNDVLNGMDGNDHLIGGAGLDTLNGGAGNDTLDIVLNGNGVQTLDGGTGTDTANLSSFGNALVLSGSGATATLAVDGTVRATLTSVETDHIALSYNQTLTIGALASGTTVVAVSDVYDDSVNASGASAGTTIVFRGGPGNDSYTAGAGYDWLDYTDGTGDVIANLSTAAHVVGGTSYAAGTVRDGFGNTDTITGTIERIDTGTGNDTVYGSDVAEEIHTGAGNDTVYAGGGNDIIDGGAGTNTLAGGTGNDTYFIFAADGGTNTIVENPNEGIDTVATDLAAFSLSGIANVENLVGFATTGQALTGNELDNVIIGGAGDDTLNGLDGNDTLVGGAGNNTLDGGTGEDTVDYLSLGNSAVTVDLAAGKALNNGLGGHDTLTAIEDVSGSNQADWIAGDANANVLNGNDGDDVLIGRGGNDVIDGGAGFDTVLYTTGAPVTGMLHRTGAAAWTLDSSLGGGTEGVDTLRNIERIVWDYNANGIVDAGDRTFLIDANGNIEVQAANDTGTATEAGGVANATAASAATGNVLANDVNLDQDAAVGDVEAVTSVVWTGATGPGTGSGDALTSVTSGGVTINGRYGSLTLNAAGAYTYTPDAAKSDLLPQGGSATETFTYTADDGSGHPATATLTITINGSNDAPVAADVATAGSEDAATITGALSATDVDQGTTLTYALKAGSVKINGVTAPDGTVTVNSNGGYSYATTANDQALAVGEHNTITFQYVANDGLADSPAKTATITVNGADDAPAIAAGTLAAGSVTELAGTANASADQASGAINFTDIDLSDRPTATIIGQSALYTDAHGTSLALSTAQLNAIKQAFGIAAHAGNTNNGAIDWTYSITDSSLDFLAAGETVVLTSTVKIDDHNGGTVNQDVTVTIHGTNDVPVIAAGTLATGSITEQAGTNNATADQAAGVINFADVDLTDRPTATITGQSAVFTDAHGTTQTLGSTDLAAIKNAFSISAAAGNANNGAINWAYSITDSKLDFLATGETVVLTSTVQIDDGHGGTVAQDVTVTIHGTNDAPTIAAGTNPSGTITEQASTANSTTDSTSGAVTFADVDLTDRPTASVTGQSVAYADVHGSALTLTSAQISAIEAGFAIVAAAGNTDNGTINWSYGIVDSALDFLSEGETVVLTSTVQIADGHGGTKAQDVTVTIHGTNDAPVVVAQTASGTENQILTLDVLPGDTDPDTNHVLSLVSASVPGGQGSVAIVNGKLVFNPGSDFDHLAQGVTANVVVTYTITDEHNAQATGTETITITGTNDAPVATNQTAAAYENQSVTADVLANDSDVDDGAVLTLVSATVPAGQGSASIVNGKIVYDPGTAFDHLAAGEQAVVAVSYTIQDEHGAQATGTLSVTLTGTNDAPVIDLNGAAAGSSAALTSLEQIAAAIAPSATVSDVDSADFNGGSLTVAFTANGAAEDQLAIANQGSGAGQIGVSGATISYGGVAFATFTGGTNGSALQISFTSAAATPAAVQALVRDLTYVDSSDDPSTAPRTLHFTLVDGDGILHSGSDTGTADATITVLPVNDPPTATATGLNPTFTEGNGRGVQGAAVGVFSGTAIGTVEAGQAIAALKFTVGGIVDGANETLGIDGSTVALTAGTHGTTATHGLDYAVTVSGGVATVTLSSAAIGTAVAQAVVDGVSYQNTNVDAPTAGDRMVTFALVQDNGGTANGGLDTTALAIHSTVHVVAIDDPGIAVDDSAGTTEDTAIVGASVFGNDSDPDSPLQVGQVNGSAAAVGTQITLASGALLTLRADGTYDYNPNHKFDGLTGVSGAANHTATDSFTYSLSDGSTATVTITITGVSSPGETVQGTSGNDTMTGTGNDERFDLSQGGSDTVSGGGGTDGFYFGAALDPTDRIDGGTGTNDQVAINGDYTGVNALTLTASMFTNVEVLVAQAGHNYSITTQGSDFAGRDTEAGGVFTVYASQTAIGDHVTFDGSAETAGSFRYYGGVGTDTVTMGAGVDGIYFGAGKFGPDDHVDGGAGIDQLALDGSWTGTISTAQVVNVETLALLDGVAGTPAHYNVTLAANWLGGTEATTKAVWAVQVREAVVVDGSAVTAGYLKFYGGQGDDTLTGGQGGNLIYGGAGADRLIAGTGADTFGYTAASQSIGTAHDTIVNFDPAHDKISLPFAVSAVDGAVSGSLSQASFDDDLTHALATLGGHHAVTFTANGGDLDGHIFLVIDANGTGGYQAGQDMVIELQTPVHPIADTSVFI